MREPAFAPKSLTAPEYVRALFASTDDVAVLVRNRAGARTVQRIAPADRVASSEFQEWLAVESARGSDIYIGMNPIKEGATAARKTTSRTSGTCIWTSTETATPPSRPFGIP